MKKLIYSLLVFSLGWSAANAQSVGINSDGSSPNSSAMLDVSSTTKGLLAPRMTAAQKTAIASPATGLLVYQTDGTAGYYYNSGTPASPVWICIGAGTIPVANGGTNATTASAALTNLGAAPLASPTFTGTPSLPTGTTGVTQTAGNSTFALATTAFVNTAAGVHAIGDSYMGGTVFYVYDNGTHGLIAATADQSTSIKWYAGTSTNTMALALGVGAGSKNTALIIANQGLGDGTNYAARVCNEYKVTINSVDYGDWYLPSHAELTLLYYQRSAVGGFSNVQYWSSTEVDQLHAYNLNFGSGVWANYNLKSDNYSVRAIRAF